MSAKYKALVKSNQLLDTFPVKRLAAFKRSKWLPLQKRLKNFQGKKLLLKNNHLEEEITDFNPLLRVKFGAWEKTSMSYRGSLESKNLVSLYCDRAFTLSKLKKELTTSSLNSLVGTLALKLEVLLWKLGLFNSTKSALKFISVKNSILVNNKSVKTSIFLAKGDVISFPNNSNALENIFLKEIFPFSLCEIDFYTKTIIVLKSRLEVGNEDIHLWFNNNINLPLFSNYLYKK
jgi:ribosomal protein S4